jgi:hypothetical protein
MNDDRRWNWPLWTGLALSLIAFISYFAFFHQFEITRDLPWANALLFLVAMALLVVGFRRAKRKVLAAIVGVIGAAVFVVFGLMIGFGTKVPASANALRVGQKAPEFVLLDTQNRPVALSGLLASAPRGVVLVFYRGHW